MLQIHRVRGLYDRLEPDTKARASNVYESVLKSDRDDRLRAATTNTLAGCLKSHDDAFKQWRYNLAEARGFYPYPMICACVSLLTTVYPTRTFTVGSATSARIEVVGGGAKQTSQDDR